MTRAISNDDVPFLSWFYARIFDGCSISMVRVDLISCFMSTFFQYSTMYKTRESLSFSNRVRRVQASGNGAMTAACGYGEKCMSACVCPGLRRRLCPFFSFLFQLGYTINVVHFLTRTACRLSSSP